MSSARQPGQPGWRARPITIQNGTSEEPVTSTWSSPNSILLPPKNSVQFSFNLAVLIYVSGLLCSLWKIIIGPNTFRGENYFRPAAYLLLALRYSSQQ